MLFTEPIPFEEALASRKVKALLPTTLSSKELREIAPELRERAMFSARTSNAFYLQQIDDTLESLLNPKQVLREGADQTITEGFNLATARVELKDALDSISYQPEEGNEGTIKDLRSDARLNLVLQTNANMAAGYGQWAQMQEEDILDEFPAQELYRAEGRKVPREWLDRWEESGGQLFDDRMIALVNDPIWDKLGDYEDGLGNPYPPFAFNSGMDVRPIDRTEAESLGLIKPNEKVVPEDRGFDDLLEASPDIKTASLKDALLTSMPGYHFEGDVLTKANEGFDEEQHPRDEQGRFSAEQINAAQEKLKAIPKGKWDDEITPQFPTEEAPFDVMAAKNAMWSLKQTVALKDLHGIQQQINHDTVKAILDTHREGYQGDRVDRTITVVQKGDKKYILDGHHRATAHKLLGADMIEARIIDLDRRDRVHQANEAELANENVTFITPQGSAQDNVCPQSLPQAPSGLSQSLDNQRNQGSQAAPGRAFHQDTTRTLPQEAGVGLPQVIDTQANQLHQVGGRLGHQGAVAQDSAQGGFKFLKSSFTRRLWGWLSSACCRANSAKGRP